jgi:multicomponent Na+:H+ antiporter subunit E
VSGAGPDGRAADDPSGDPTGADAEVAGVPKWPVVGVVLAVLWLFVRGVAPGGTLEATARHVLGEFLFGLAVGLPTAFALRRYYRPRIAVGRSLRVTPYAVLYVVVFLRELLTANVDVAYRVLAPSMPMRPDVIAIPLRVESDAAVTTIANSITLTPGTLTMDHDAGTNTLYVHAIAARDHESVVVPIRTWEDYALVVFEDRDPNTEVPRTAYSDPAGVRADEGAAGEGGPAVEDGDSEPGVEERSPPRSPDGDGGPGADATRDRRGERTAGGDDATDDGGDDRGR